MWAHVTSCHAVPTHGNPHVRPVVLYIHNCDFQSNLCRTSDRCTTTFPYPVGPIHRYIYTYIHNTYTPLPSLYFVIPKRIIRVIPENRIVARQSNKFLAFEGIQSFINVFTKSSTLAHIFIHANPARSLTYFQERPFLLFLTCAQFFQVNSPFWFSDYNCVCVSIVTVPNILRTSTKLARVKDRQSGLKNDILK